MCAAAGGRPFGTTVVHDGVVIGRSGARKDSYKSPTGHAEIVALEEAASYLGTADMTGCTMYTNRGSCIACSASMVSHNLSLVVRGIRPTETDHEYLDHLIALLGRGDHTKVISGVLFEETAQQFQDAGGLGADRP